MYQFEFEIAQINHARNVLMDLNIMTEELWKETNTWKNKVTRLVKVDAMLEQPIVFPDGGTTLSVVHMGQRHSAIQNEWSHLMRWYGSLLASFVDGDIQPVVKEQEVKVDFTTTYGHGHSTFTQPSKGKVSK